MGLDMYLYRKFTHCNMPTQHDENGNNCEPGKKERIFEQRTDYGGKITARWEKTNKPWELEIPSCKDATITITDEVGYWRKANQIMAYMSKLYAIYHFDDPFPNCGKLTLEAEQLTELRNVCKQVLENPDLAPELLPTQEGFFWGSTEYDECYKQDLQHTVDMINSILDWEQGNKDKYPNWIISYEFHADW